jgi:hypothetical protein
LGLHKMMNPFVESLESGWARPLEAGEFG